eukprot:gene12431-6183_t
MQSEPNQMYQSLISESIFKPLQTNKFEGEKISEITATFKSQLVNPEKFLKHHLNLREIYDHPAESFVKQLKVLNFKDKDIAVILLIKQTLVALRMDYLETKTKAVTKHWQLSRFLPEPNISLIPKQEEFIVEKDQPTKTDLEKAMIKLAQIKMEKHLEIISNQSNQFILDKTIDVHSNKNYQESRILRDLFKSKNLPTY